MRNLIYMSKMEEKEIEFDKLRLAYMAVKGFLEDYSFEKVNNLNTKVEEDLFLSGDDNLEMLESFVEKFKLEYGGFDYLKHFHSEYEITEPSLFFANLMSLPIWIPMKAIELVFLNKLELPKPKFIGPDREVLDLTFRQLICWYLEGSYPGKKIKYKITTPSKRLNSSIIE